MRLEIAIHLTHTEPPTGEVVVEERVEPFIGWLQLLGLLSQALERGDAIGPGPEPPTFDSTGR